MVSELEQVVTIATTSVVTVALLIFFKTRMAHLLHVKVSDLLVLKMDIVVVAWLAQHEVVRNATLKSKFVMDNINQTRSVASLFFLCSKILSLIHI